MSTKAHQIKTKVKASVFDVMGNLTMQRLLITKDGQPNTIDMKVTNANNELVKEVKGIPSDSFTRNWISFLYSHIANRTPADDLYRDINNQNQNPLINLKFFIDALANEGHGIRVGTGSVAVDIDDYILDSMIPIGTGSMELNLSAMTINAPVISGSCYKIACSRTITNQSGGTVPIRECGLLNEGMYMIARDINTKSSGSIFVDLLDEQSVEFTHNLYFDNSEGWVKAHTLQIYNGFVPLAYATTLDTDGDVNAAGSYVLGSLTPNQTNAGVGSDYGILVGTGSVAVDIDDYKVDGVISHGTGTGQLTHNAVELDLELLKTDQTMVFTISRTFVNNSAAMITIRNVGAVASNTTGRRMLIVRTLTGDIDVDIGASLKLDYTYEMISG